MSEFRRKSKSTDYVAFICAAIQKPGSLKDKLVLVAMLTEELKRAAP